MQIWKPDTIPLCGNTMARDQLAQHRCVAHRCVVFEVEVRTIKKASSGMTIA